MTSKPRHSHKWRWAAAAAVAVFLMYFFVWSGDGQGTQTRDGSIQSASASQVAPSGKEGPTRQVRLASQRLSSTADLPPMQRPTAGKAPPSGPVVKTLTIGQTGANAPHSGSVPASVVSSSPTPTARAAQRPPEATPAPARRSSSARSGTQFTRGMNMIREGRLVQGRRELSQLLFAQDGQLSPLDAQTIRDTLTSINQQLVFSAEVIPGDPTAEAYMVQRGDYLSRIAPQYRIPYAFIERINRVSAKTLQAGKPIKVIKGPFHARISKSDFRMDIYLNDADGQPLYVRSFPVGLGESDSTPTGAFIVTPGRKVKNPDWRNPRTGKYYKRDDPGNPIGEYWLALKGTEPATESYTGYGLHGTIDPQSIGRQVSMGCIRLRDKDIKLVYDMLDGGTSTVHIVW